MARQYGRNRRVADLIQRELAVLVQRELVDSHLGLVTISAVDVSPDLKNARIYVTCLGEGQTPENLIHVLDELSGHYRHEMARTLSLRSVPRLKFVYDESIQRGKHLSDLIDSLHKAGNNE
jgi:ribosome-binding factor A